MKGLLVMNRFGHTESFRKLRLALEAAAPAAGMELCFRFNDALPFDLAAGKPLFPDTAYDFCLFWDKDILLGRQLEAMGLRVFNPIDAIELADDKARTHLALARAGLPQPKTMAAPLTFAGLGYPAVDFLDDAIAYLGLPLVIKECKGSFGWQVYLAHTREEAAAILQKHAPTPMLLQAYVGFQRGVDLRLYVVGRRVEAAIRRSNPNDFRANVAGGGSAEAYTPTAAEADLALRAAEALGLDFAGVDLLLGPDGPLVCEVNSNAHFHGLMASTGVNIPGAILRHIKTALLG